MKNPKIKGLIAGFFSLMFFVVLLAGGTNIVFSSQKVSSWIRSGIESADLENVEITFENAKTTWTGSFTYPFGVRVSSVNIKIEKEECRVQQAEFESLVIPFSISAALKKKADLGVVKAYGGDFSKYKTCIKEIKKSSAESKLKKYTKLRTEERVIAFLHGLQDVKKIKLNENFSIRGFLFSDLKALSRIMKRNLHTFIIDRLKVGIVSETEYEAQWHGTYTIENLSEKINHIIKLSGSLEIGSDTLNFLASGRKKEGVFNLEIKAPFWKASEKKPFLKLGFENFPVSSASDIFGLDLKFPAEKKRASWLDCDLTSSIGKDEILLRSSKCLIKGDLGSYNVTSGIDLDWRRDRLKWEPRKSIDMRVSNVSLGDVYPVFGRTGPEGLFGDSGKLSIDISIVSFDSAYAEFELKDFSILFRSKGVSSFQKGKSARGTGAIISRDKFDFAIEEMDLEKGEFEGSIRGTFDLSKSTLDLDFEIPHLVINPEISKKLYKTDIGFFSIEGDGGFDYKKSQHSLNLKFGFDEIISKNWKLGGAQMPCRVLNKSVDCTFKLERLSFSKRVQEKLESESKDFQNLSGNLNYFKKELKLRALSANLKSLVFDASWSKDKGLEGSLLENGKTSKKLNFRDFK